tara:strand:- start:38608 stop:39294 length:687 start_codon:yes stop_codon:yes gene_type:complete
MSFSSLDLTNTFSSYAGVDIRVMFGSKTVGEMQAISYAVQREKAPIYVMGRVDPISFSRGKRGIAGTMISLLLDQHLMKSGVWENTGYIADKDEIFASDTLKSTDLPAGADLTDVAGGDAAGGPTEILTGANLDSIVGKANASYVDQLLPFDVTIVAANEYGSASAMRIYGCEILNEGSGFSIDDIVIENQMTYICRVIAPWKLLGSFDPSKNFAWTSATDPVDAGAE